MKLSISATNPCHLYDLALALHRRGALSRFYSGYPRWKLRPPADLPIVTRSARTLVTYAALRLPPPIRPAMHRLFRWQDRGFDGAIGRALEGDTAAWVHAMPGQALQTFQGAKRRGLGTVLNHASGPVREQLALVAEEFRRANVPLELHHGFDRAYFAQEDAEYAAADRHCVASSVVRRQLIARGVDAARIWTVPYGADLRRFHPPASPAAAPRHRVVYAGQVALRKGLRIALAALREMRQNAPVTFDLYGGIADDMRGSIAEFTREPWVTLHGAVRQDALAEIFRSASLLVLPSWEEAFGLVVVQALNCGLPCLVSNRVGAADLIVHRQNGSIFPAGDAAALAREIAWWSAQSAPLPPRPLGWDEPAARLLALSGGETP